MLFLAKSAVKRQRFRPSWLMKLAERLNGLLGLNGLESAFRQGGSGSHISEERGITSSERKEGQVYAYKLVIRES